MTIENTVSCNGCGEKKEVKLKSLLPNSLMPTSGWMRAMVLGPDGMQFVDSEGDLCESCKIDFRRWLVAHREEADKKRAKIQ